MDYLNSTTIMTKSLTHRVNFLLGVIMTLLFMFVVGNAHGSSSPIKSKPVNHCVKYTGKANAKMMKHTNPRHYRLLKRNHKRNSKPIKVSGVSKATFHGNYASSESKPETSYCTPKFR